MVDSNIKKSNSINGYLLLSNGDFHIVEIVATLIRKYNVDIKYDETTTAFTFIYKDTVIGASFVNAPMESNIAVEGCKYNFLWQNSEDIVASHTAHVLLSVMNCPNVLEGYKLFTSIMSVLANFENALAIYMPAPNMTLNARTYVEDARMIAKRKNPIHLWICICPIVLEDATVVYTYGLNEFGKNEIEVRSTQKHYMELFDFVYNLADSIITQDIDLVTGDAVNTVNGETVNAIVNKGIYIDRVSSKFNL